MIRNFRHGVVFLLRMYSTGYVESQPLCTPPIALYSSLLGFTKGGEHVDYLESMRESLPALSSRSSAPGESDPPPFHGFETGCCADHTSSTQHLRSEVEGWQHDEPHEWSTSAATSLPTQKIRSATE